MKTRKNNVKKSEVKEQLIKSQETCVNAIINDTRVNDASAIFRHNMQIAEELFNNEVKEKVVTIDVSRISAIDVMKTSRVAFFRKAVLTDVSFNLLANYDFKFYNQTNDRSKSRKSDKYVDDHLNVEYVRQRTAKQLRDVLKERNIVDYLNKKYNKSFLYYTVSQYKELVK